MVPLRCSDNISFYQHLSANFLMAFVQSHFSYLTCYFLPCDIPEKFWNGGNTFFKQLLFVILPHMPCFFHIILRPVENGSAVFFRKLFQKLPKHKESANAH